MTDLSSATAPTGHMLIGGESLAGSQSPVHGVDPRTGEALQPAFGGSTAGDVAKACLLAAAAFDTYRSTALEARAVFLERIATEILALGDLLVERTYAETGLPRPRVEGERGRTVGQLRLFAGVLRDGGFLDIRIDHALPDRTPLPRPDLRLRRIAIGPVAVFGASNFPLAFSVAGGDTASALAAGCPVVVKAHPAHPGASELVGRAIQRALAACALPAGVFALVGGPGIEVGTALAADPNIKAVGFTGSRRGGLALAKVAAARPEPIPVYAEMSSINPVFLLPAALKARGDAIAAGFVTSLTVGGGQMCTNPGLVLAIDGPDLDRFLDAARTGVSASPASTMLTSGIQGAYRDGVEHLAGHAALETLARGQAETGPTQGQAGLFATDLHSYLGHPVLREEVFGAASVVVRCADEAGLHQAAEALEGQLTATLQMDEADMAIARGLLPVLERKVGRILVNGFPTGVEVSDAMVHGGPFPATSDTRTTSVGTLAIDRFLRPVSYQNFPAGLLPEGLDEANALGLVRRVDGIVQGV